MMFTIIILLLIGIGYTFLLLTQKPSNDRDWAPDVAILPSGQLSGETLTLKNIRAFRYGADGSMMEKRFEKVFSIHDIRSVDLFIEPFSFVVGPAHSLLSFSLADGSHIVISVEVRRQKHQRSASFWLSAFRQYGLCYVVADEEDAVFLRSHIRKDSVYLHPLRLTPAESQQLFLSMIERMNALIHAPELYNLSSNTCATNIRTHLNTVLKKKLPFHWSLLLPVFFPRYLYNHHLINTDLSFEEHLERARINDKPEKYPDLSYSEAIRK